MNQKDRVRLPEGMTFEQFKKALALMPPERGEVRMTKTLGEIAAEVKEQLGKKEDGWEVVGHIWLDTASILVCDPANLRDPSRQIQNFLDNCFETGNWPDVAQIGDDPPGMLLGERVGVVVSTYEDGHYPVEVLYGKDGQPQGIRIMFDKNPWKEEVTE